jgi:hypothetical protein
VAAALIRVHGFELEQTVETLSAAWDRRMLPVANAEAVSVVVADGVRDAEGWLTGRTDRTELPDD